MYTRQRTKGAFTANNATTSLITSPFSGADQVASSGGMNVVVGGPFVVTEDVEIKNFHSRRAAGETFCNPFLSFSEIRTFADRAITAQRGEPLYTNEPTSAWKSQTRQDCLRTFGTALRPQMLNPADSNQFGYDVGGVNAMMLRNAAQRDVAWNAALADMAKTNALLLVTAAELHKTVKMVGEYALLLRGQLGRLEYLVKSSGKSAQDAQSLARLIANEWLKIRYGVMPLVYEIQGVVQALAGPSKPERVTARGKSGYTDSYTRSVSYPPNGFRPGINLTSVTNITGTVRAGVLYEPILDTLQSRLGLHPTVLPEVFFELTRLSFVADWFMDLSSTIRACNATFYGKSLCGWITETVEGQTNHSASGGSNSVQYVTVSGVQKTTTWSWTSPPNGATAVSTFKIKSRTPVEGLRVKTPSIRVKLNALRIADGLALISQTLARASHLGKSARL